MSPATAPTAPSRAPAWREAARLLSWATAYLLALLWALTEMLPGASVSLVWPAAGVGVLWLLVEGPGARRRRAVLALAVLTVLGNLVSGIDLRPSLGWGGVNVAHALVGAGVLHRLLGRARPLREVSDLAGLLAASLLAAAVSGLLGSLVATAVFGLPWASGLALLVLRNAVSTLVVVAVGLALLGLRAHAPRRGAAGGLEHALAATAAVAGTAVLFDELPPSLVFLLLPLTVWVATRTGVLTTTAVVTAQSVLVVLSTLDSRGPFAVLTGEDRRAMAALTLLAVVVLVGLCLALAEDERSAAHEESRRSRDRLQDNLDAALVGQAALELPARGGARIADANPALARLVQQPVEELVGRDWLHLVLPQDRARLRAVLRGFSRGTRTGWHGELRLRVGSGVESADVWVDAVLGLVDTAAGSPVTVTAQFLDTTARKQAEEQLSHLALHDELTGLPNRALWRDRAERALAAAGRRGRPRRRAVRRPGPLQGRQRRARPRGRRRPAGRGGRPPGVRGPAAGHGGAHRRRRVRRALPGRPGRRRAGRRVRAAAGLPRPGRRGRHDAPDRHRQHRHRLLRRRGRRPAGAAARRRRRPVQRQGVRAGPGRAQRGGGAAGALGDAAAARSWVGRWRWASWWCTTSRWSTSRPARPSRPRRSSAGSTPSAGCWDRPSGWTRWR